MKLRQRRLSGIRRSRRYHEIHSRRLRKIPAPLRRRWHRGVVDEGALVLPQPAVGKEEKRLVPANGPAYRPAKLVSVQRRGIRVLPVVRVQRIVPPELEQRAMELICP